MNDFLIFHVDGIRIKYLKIEIVFNKNKWKKRFVSFFFSFIYLKEVKELHYIVIWFNHLISNDWIFGINFRMQRKLIIFAFVEWFRNWIMCFGKNDRWGNVLKSKKIICLIAFRVEFVFNQWRRDNWIFFYVDTQIDWCK